MNLVNNMKQKTIENKKQQRTLKKRFILLNLVALICCTIAIRYVAQAGDYYTLRTRTYHPAAEVTDVVVDCENEGIVEMTGFRQDSDGQLLIDLHSLSRGETDISFQPVFTEQYEAVMITTHLRVGLTGTIIEDFFGTINFSGFEVILALVLGYLTLTLGVMIFSFVECLKTAQYSYRMIAYGGVALYLGLLLTILFYKLFNNGLGTFSELVILITSTADWFLALMFLPMAVLAVAVSVSNIWLMRHEGFRPVNALGIAASVVWIIGLVATSLIDDLIVSLIGSKGSTAAVKIFYIILYVLTYLITYFESMLISTTLCAFLASRHTPPYDRDCIIILGCAIRGDGSLTPLLRGRVDSALDFEKTQYEKTGRHACFVPSGGQGSDEIMSEGEAMENYLLSQGVEQERILREDKSVNTFQNMQFSKEVIEQKLGAVDDKKIAFATTNYHVFRGYILSKKNGFEAQGISAKTKWYFFPNAFLREFIGLLYDQKLRHIAVILCIVLAAVAYALLF